MGYDPFDIVKDSSIWRSWNDQDAISRKDPYLRVGIVKRVYTDVKSSTLRYLVEVRDRSDAIEINAQQMRKFGGIYNYEGMVLQGYRVGDLPDATNDFAAKAGDTVLVACLNGEQREGIIIGGLSHPGRKSKVSVHDGPIYISEFNGI